MSVENIRNRLRNAREIIEIKAREIVERDDIIKVYDEKPSGKERIYSVDGGFRYISPYVGTLTVSRVYRVERKRGEGYIARPARYEDQGGLEGKIGSDIYVFYLNDIVIEDSSLRMLLIEAKTAKRLLDSGKKPIILDGPIFNPPIESIVNRNLEPYLAENRGIRLDLYKEKEVLGIIKRPSRPILKEELKELSEVYGAENMLVNAIFIEKRRRLYEEIGKEAYLKPIVIGPLEYRYEEYGVTTYNRYVQRTVTHKHVVVERSVREFPERLFDPMIRPRSARLRGPIPLEVAHMFANVKEQEADNVASIIYRLLKKELDARRSGRYYFKSYEAQRR